MLTAILKSRTIVALALSYLVGAGILLFSVLMMTESGLGNELLYSHWAFSWLEHYTYTIPYISLFLVAIASVLGRLRLREAKQALGNSNLTMLTFIVLIMVQANTALLRPDILVATVISTGMYLLLLSVYKRDSAQSELFHLGLLLGTTILFVGQTIFLILSIGFSFLILRTGKWKEWVVLFLGIGMTAIFVLLVVVWHVNPLLGFQRVIQTAWLDNIAFARINAGHIVLAPVIAASVMGILGSLAQGKVAERNIALSNIGWVVSVMLMVLILGLGWQNGLILIAFPISTYVAKTLERTTRWWLADLLLLVILSAPFVSSLWQL